MDDDDDDDDDDDNDGDDDEDDDDDDKVINGCEEAPQCLMIPNNHIHIYNDIEESSDYPHKILHDFLQG